MGTDKIEMPRRGGLFIVSGPSGAGKTAICTPALGRLQGISLSVSVTTRQPRGDEADGVDYRFVADAEFDAMVASGELAEWAEVHGHRYGTTRAAIDRALEGGRDLLLDIDVQGAVQIKRAYPAAVAIFLLPPSRELLEQRLRARGTDSEETVRERLRNACSEIGGVRGYDYVVVNDDLDTAVERFLAIVYAERHRLDRFDPGDLDALASAFAEDS